MSGRKRTVVWAGIALVGSGAVIGSSTDSSSATTSGAGTPTAKAAASTTRVHQARLAIDTARKAVRDGRPYDLERDRRWGATVWEVKVASGTRRPYELDVSADGRRVVRTRRDDHRGIDARRAPLAKVGLRRALLVAGRHAGGALTEAEIDRHRGKLVWTVTFVRSGVESEVAIDARTAKLVVVRRGSDRD